MKVDMDRAIGALVGLACGDALGAGHEFTHPGPEKPITMSGGRMWGPGEWTDDTEMAICIAEAAATGHLDPAVVGDRFIAWRSSHPKDIGIQTSSVLGSAASGTELPQRAHEYCSTHGKCGGNGSLMRTAPVALAHLGDRDTIATAAREISDLTHADPDAGDACVLWCLAIDTLVQADDPSLEPGPASVLAQALDWIPEPRREVWAERIRQAEAASAGTFARNGYVVTALQAAWAAITQTPVPTDRPGHHLHDALVAAVRIGHDTDTVAAIAGMLLGARWGVSAIPTAWKALLHHKERPGWDGCDARGLTRLAVLTVKQGRSDPAGWPDTPTLLDHYRHHNPGRTADVALQSDPGVRIGSVFSAPDTDADVIVSLCRMGSQSLRPVGFHVDVHLLDETNPAKNPNLLQVLEDVADAIRSWRAEGKMVFLHCVNAQNRTPTAAAAYLIRHHQMTPAEALGEVTSVLGNGPSNGTFHEALGSIQPAG